MTTKDAKRLLKMTVVIWDNDPADSGVVLELGPAGFFVDWANGQRGWIDYKDAQRINLYQPESTDSKEAIV